MLLVWGGRCDLSPLQPVHPPRSPLISPLIRGRGHVPIPARPEQKISIITPRMVPARRGPEPGIRKVCVCVGGGGGGGRLCYRGEASRHPPDPRRADAPTASCAQFPWK
jgi:hypothetical protein